MAAPPAGIEPSGTQHVALTYGSTAYRLYGNAARGTPLLVCVHAVTCPQFTAVGLASALESSFRVLTFDRYGRGLSDCARQSVAFKSSPLETIDLYVRQIDDLLQSLALHDEPLVVLGHSMGGAIAAAFAARNSHRMKGLLLISPAGLIAPPGVPTGLTMGLLRAGFIGRFIWSLVGTSSLQGSVDNGKFANGDLGSWPAIADEEPEMVKCVADVTTWQIQHKPDFLTEFHQDLISFPWGGLQDEYAAIAAQTYPVTFVWGELDASQPFERFSQVFAPVIPRAKLVNIPEAYHSPHFVRATLPKVVEACRQLLVEASA